MSETIKLTQFSPGAGCGCKLSTTDLEKILIKEGPDQAFAHLLVGNHTKDDAAVYAIDDQQAVISTTDFFTPIVDSPFDFGRIASVNAISDVYAMGGRPLMAIAILGWPVSKLPLETAQQVISGARAACQEAGIPLAGGHSIEIADPVFGLAVTGIVPIDRVKRNNSATSGSRLFLTKPLGVGIIATAEKRGLADPRDTQNIVASMSTLNRIGESLGKFSAVSSMTDVTGFGLLGHLLEICEGSGLHAEIAFDKVPVLNNLQTYIDQKTLPGGLFRNFDSYGHKVSPLSDQQKFVLCDPQTSGGLLVAVSEEGIDEVVAAMKRHNQPFFEIGFLRKADDTPAIVTVA
jgi:selenide,water dikinase